MSAGLCRGMPSCPWGLPLLARNPGSQRDICPAAGSRQRPSAGRRADPGDRPAGRGCAGPGRIAVPYRNAARWRIRRRRTTRTLSEHHRTHPAQPSITTAPWPGCPAPIGLRTARETPAQHFKIAQNICSQLRSAMGVGSEHRSASSGPAQEDGLNCISGIKPSTNPDAGAPTTARVLVPAEAERLVGRVGVDPPVHPAG